MRAAATPRRTPPDVKVADAAKIVEFILGPEATKPFPYNKVAELSAALGPGAAMRRATVLMGGHRDLTDAETYGWRLAVEALRDETLVGKLAMLTELHHIDDPADADACVCGDWRDGTEEESWDQHIAAVSLSALADYLDSLVDRSGLMVTEDDLAALEGPMAGDR